VVQAPDREINCDFERLDRETSLTRTAFPLFMA
jgi:hypothetical protein